jgi:fumarate hydratase class I
MITTIDYPFTIEKIRGLKLGEQVSLNGKIVTGRDRVHKFLAEGGKCPAELKNGALFHCGPAVIRRDSTWVITAAGPTTSMREEPYMPGIIEQCRLRVIIGKGGMGRGTQKACAEFGCVYLQAVGGAAQVLNESIERVTAVHFKKEFGIAEAIWELEVRNFPAIVAIDAQGKSLHERVERSSKRVLRQMLKNGRPFIGKAR